MNLQPVDGFRTGIPLAATLVILMHSTARSSSPSPDQSAEWENHEQQVKERQERALPWKTALENAFAKESTGVAHYLFLTTYKHHVRDSDKSATDEKPAALALLKGWQKAKAECVKAGLPPDELAVAIYRFTNSDWAPVSATTGPGLDKVATPNDFGEWARAVIAIGKLALKENLEPGSVWSRQAASYQVHTPQDISKVGLNPITPRH